MSRRDPPPRWTKTRAFEDAAARLRRLLVRADRARDDERRARLDAEIEEAKAEIGRLKEAFAR